MASRPATGTTGDERVVAGRYVLLEPLGSGGMGTVWRARDEVLGRDVAVKEVLFPPGISDADRGVLRERTRREARAAARLHHPSAVTVHDVVEDGGAPFIVMELVNARTLADVVRSDGPLPPQRVAQIGLAVLGALVAAHRQGILHRDVKPGNVLIADSEDTGSSGRVVLTDFGIATSSGDSSITHTGLLLGSPSYISPERARGQSPGPASDLWALGATLYTAVEGRPPFDAGEPLATVVAVASGDPAPVQAAGPLAPVLTGLLAREPADRIDAATARRMLEDVARRPATVPLAKPAPATAADGRRAEHTQVLPVGRSAAAAGAAAAAAAGAAAAKATAPAPAAPTAPPAAPTAPPAAPTAPAAAPTAPAVAPTAAPAAPPASVPRPRPPARRRRSRALPLALAALLLVGALVGVGALLSHRDPASVAAPRPSASAGTSSAPSSAPSTTPSSGGSGKPSPSASAAAAAGGAAAAPAGWRSATGGPGWTAFVPPSYVTGSFSGSPEYRDPATGRTLRVSTTAAGGGGADAVKDRRDQAASFSASHAGYQEISIAPVDYRGYEAADWEFLYGTGSGAEHALSRVFVVNGRGYSLFFQTRAGDDWTAARAEFERMSASFRPA